MSLPSSPVILICTVGGSHEPILTAIRQTSPDFVCFICSGKDPATGRPGSDVQIIGKGSIIKKSPLDEKPTLPNIPTQGGLREDHYEVVEVLADDLEQAFGQIRMALLDLSRRFPIGRFLADYTGGTKTMTAALVTAALESETVELQLVTGSRVDLIKVQSGMEAAIPANVECIRLERAMAPYIAAWQRFAYAEAAQGLAGLKSPRDRDLLARLRTLRDLSYAFDAWDRFDHAAAFVLLDAYRPKIGQFLGKHLDALKWLTMATDRQEPMRLLDLWRNAQRRAAQGRYDDAVARIYRLLEWSAQWLLRKHCNLDTADIPPERVPDGMQLSINRKGKLQAALFDAWELVERLTTGPASEFIKQNKKQLLTHLLIRNGSILAHGFTPVSEKEWRTFTSWMDEYLLPPLLAEAADLKIAMPPQLPTGPVWEIR
ncbi:MAG TPA: TIGR02710 family CRISPR-associated CARF protein [Candidatus Competibacteraceae bacterium]|nr:TIGR02710 family CRISPR-associated CARF protein [Candidatus Competibacteraceae bacterium]